MLRRTFVLRRQFASSASKKASSKGSSNAGREAVFIDGCRTPFQMSGTGYKDLLGWQLGRLALHGLAERNPALEERRSSDLRQRNSRGAHSQRRSWIGACCRLPTICTGQHSHYGMRKSVFCLVSVVLSNFFGFYVTFFLKIPLFNCTRACFKRCFSLWFSGVYLE